VPIVRAPVHEPLLALCRSCAMLATGWHAVTEFEAIQEAVGDVMGVWPGAMTSRERRGLAVFARQAAMYDARELTGAGFATIARAFGRKDHASACVAYHSRDRYAPVHDGPRAKWLVTAYFALATRKLVDRVTHGLQSYCPLRSYAEAP